MSTEKSVDPELGGVPMYPINHVANLCLIMRSVHTQTKNTINNLQDINAIAVGETRRIVMAVPEEGKERMMLHAQNIRADVQPPAETSYFALGPSLQITRELERMMRDNISVPPDQAQIFYEVQIADNFKHTIKLWTALAASLDRGVKDSSFKARDAKAVRENCDGFLIPLEKAMIAAHMPQDVVDSLRDIGNRIYANLDLVSQGESPARNMPQKQEKHIDVRSG